MVCATTDEEARVEDPAAAEPALVVAGAAEPEGAAPLVVAAPVAAQDA